MRSTWADSHLDDPAAAASRRFDDLDEELREIRSEIGSLHRTVIQISAVVVAVVLVVVVTQAGLIIAGP